MKEISEEIQDAIESLDNSIKSIEWEIDQAYENLGGARARLRRLKRIYETETEKEGE